MGQRIGDGRFEHQAFLLLLIAVTVAFGWILYPFYGAIFWAIIMAVIFTPLNRQLLKRLGERPNFTASVTELFIIAIVLVPLALIAASLTQEGTGFYAKIKSGEYDFADYAQRAFDALPSWTRGLLDRFNFTDISAFRESIASSVAKGGQALAPQALIIGMNTFDFLIGLSIMLYLLFFLLRDGKAMASNFKSMIPLRAEQKTTFFARFAEVVGATVKGGILVAIVQGALGGLAFWFLGIHAPILWAVMMAFLSLIPAIGAALVWVPVAVYLWATGSVWQSVTLVLYGLLVIGLVDNLLRPFLVGKDTRLPDYVVLISTLGGIEVFGLNGLVIGPLIAAFFMVSWEIFAKSEQQTERFSRPE